MNIFIMILMAVLMMGYYMISAPSTRVGSIDTDTAVNQADLRGIAECATAVHNAQIRGTEFSDICVEQAEIKSQFVCLNSGMSIMDCSGSGRRKPAYRFIITTTGPLSYDNYNSMMEILEKYYADSGTFGIFQDGKIVSGGTVNKRAVPKAIEKKLEMTDGQLVYMTQFEIPDTDQEYTAQNAPDINCPAGTAKTYRFGRWQCVGYNTKTDCGGDMIWDSDLLECVPDESRKPLCASSQTAVIVDEVWECINPFPDRECPGNMTLRLNYETLEWECVSNPSEAATTTKCAHVTSGVIFGRGGSTLRVLRNSSCTECEKLVTDPETCISVCVPDPSKIGNPSCYAQRCDGPSRAFYFGFPNYAYIKNVSDLRGVSVLFDANHEQNRMFNCRDCGDGVIDTEKSRPPYVAVCK